MGEQSDEHRDLRRGSGEIGTNCARMTALGNTEAARNEPREKRQRRGQRQRRENEPRPDPGGGGSEGPSRDQREKGGRRRQRAAQVVDHFPAADQGDLSSSVGIRGLAPVGTQAVAAAENPGKQLPIAARPSMLPSGRDVVARRKLLNNLNFGD